MNKKIRTSILLSLSCAVLSSCNIPGITKNNIDDEDDYLLYSSSNISEVSQAENNEEWVIKPSVSATNIIVPDLSHIDTSLKINKAFINAAIIYNDGKYGFITYDGDTIVQPKYDYYYIDSNGDMLLYNIAAESVTTCTLDANGSIIYGSELPKNNDPEYYWDTENQKVLIKYPEQDYAKEYNGDLTVAPMTANTTKIDNDVYAVHKPEEPKYGLVQKNKIILDFKYDDCYAPPYRDAIDTAIAFKSGEKWKYVNLDGEEIIKSQCSDVLSSFNASNSQENSHPFLYNENLVPVKINSKFSYYNMNGDCITKSYDQARPVINGRAWVKTNDKWGVLKLGKIKKIKFSTTTTTTTTTLAYTNNTYSTTDTTTEKSKTSKKATSESGKKTDKITEQKQTSQKTQKSTLVTHLDTTAPTKVTTTAAPQKETTINQTEKQTKKDR